MILTVDQACVQLNSVINIADSITAQNYYP
jgi:hypothetical protein